MQEPSTVSESEPEAKDNDGKCLLGMCR